MAEGHAFALRLSWGLRIAYPEEGVQRRIGTPSNADAPLGFPVGTVRAFQD